MEESDVEVSVSPVASDDGGSVEVQGTLGDDSVMNFAAVDGAGKDVFGGKDVVFGVEEDDAGDFVRQVGAAGDQVAAGLPGLWMWPSRWRRCSKMVT
ncbi:hypothetical protein ATB53_08830 [Xanthomonas translucens]|uniref:Uncharacterized protein n=1 Tax=Xanthomonas campestris pv. translucens TaxID=343 RepID=A0A125PWM4_XANCT|nr:hypothetical protein ATB53_08830 [Xanthomonas translucens]